MKKYKGFEVELRKHKDYRYYYIGSEKHGQIAPSDQAQPCTLKECKEVINNFLLQNGK